MDASQNDGQTPRRQQYHNQPDLEHCSTGRQATLSCAYGFSGSSSCVRVCRSASKSKHFAQEVHTNVTVNLETADKFRSRAVPCDGQVEISASSDGMSMPGPEATTACRRSVAEGWKCDGRGNVTFEAAEKETPDAAHHRRDTCKAGAVSCQRRGGGYDVFLVR